MSSCLGVLAGRSQTGSQLLCCVVLLVVCIVFSVRPHSAYFTGGATRAWTSTPTKIIRVAQGVSSITSACVFVLSIVLFSSLCRFVSRELLLQRSAILSLARCECSGLGGARSVTGQARQVIRSLCANPQLQLASSCAALFSYGTCLCSQVYSRELWTR